ncbi:Protein phosphatase 2A [Theobroma cacao]|nr:Protein phosphatase 2A [Theobroma cacao]
MIPLFCRIASCLSSPHFKVAEKGFSLFNIHGNIQNLIKQYLDVILPIIFTDLEESAMNHWRPEIQKLAHDIL